MIRMTLASNTGKSIDIAEHKSPFLDLVDHENYFVRSLTQRKMLNFHQTSMILL